MYANISYLDTNSDTKRALLQIELCISLAKNHKYADKSATWVYDIQ